MATISAANALALMDSVAKHIIDSVALVGSSSGITAGQATTLSKIAALNDASQIFFLLDSFESAVQSENAWLTNEASYNAILDLWFPVCAALDNATGGLQAFMQSNTQQADPHWLDAFNRAVGKGALHPSVLLKAFQSFGPIAASMGTIGVTGSGTGNFNAGTGEPAAYGNAPLSIFNSGAGATGAASATYTVTYNKYDTSGNLQTGQTATATMPASSAAGTTVALSGGAAGIAITNMTLTGGTNGDTISVKSALVRAVTY